jgi:hypothetical protein
MCVSLRNTADHALASVATGRSFLATCLIGWIAFGVFCQPAIADDAPNVLFIAVDDLRDWVGHLGGHPQAKTPNIDRLANNRIWFLTPFCSY